MTAPQRIAWVLNLDAEEELAGRGRAYTRSNAMAEHLQRNRLRIPDLVAKADWIVDEGAPPFAPGSYAGLAWCPTPAALRALERCGIVPGPSPGFEILRKVNHRRFSAELGQTLPGARYLEDLAGWTEFSSWLSGGELWLLKRPFGFAGRGRRRVVGGGLGEDDQAWIRASFEAGEGLQAEPLVKRNLDCALHGHVDAQGTLLLGRPTIQRTDDRGAWLETKEAVAAELELHERRALLDEAEKVARALREVRYFGPFGIDAFRFETKDGRQAFQPRSEINARFSMGWAIGMREHLEELRRRWLEGQSGP